MNQFLGIQVEEIPGDPPIALFTFETNIESVQTKILSHQEPEETSTRNKIIRLLEANSKGEDTPSLAIESDGRIAYTDVHCPQCHSQHVKRNGTQKRKLKGFFNTVLDLRLQKYQCKGCLHHFKVDLSHIVKKYAHYTNDIRDQAIGFAGERSLSLGESVDMLEEISAVKVTREAIRLWKKAKGSSIQTTLDNLDLPWSGIYSFDEQYITIQGERWYRCLLYDVILGRPVNDFLIPERNEDEIIDFLKASLQNKPLETIVVDSPWYISMLQRHFPEASIQLCIVHAMARAKRDFQVAAGHSPNSKKELPPELKKLLGKLWNIFLNIKTPEEAEERFLELFHARFDYPTKVRHRLELMAENFVFLTEYLVNPQVPRTNNSAEGYFKRTYPDQIKTKYRAPEGFQAQIMCIDGRKGDILDSRPCYHKTLEKIYCAFGELIVAASKS